MRVATLLTFVVLASAAPSQAPDLIPAPYVSPKYVAPKSAPSSIVVGGREEPGKRLIVTGQVTDGLSVSGRVFIGIIALGFAFLIYVVFKAGENWGQRAGYRFTRSENPWLFWFYVVMLIALSSFCAFVAVYNP